jgi:hypothetical protein
MHEKKNPGGAVCAAPQGARRRSAEKKSRHSLAAPTAQAPRNNVITALIARLVPDPDGGWLVVTDRGHGWLFGDRVAAIREKEWLDAQWRRRRP